MKKIVFCALRPFDVTLFLGFRRLLHALGITCESTLLLVDHPYFKKVPGLDVFLDYFDKTFRLPYCDFFKDPFKLFKRSLEFKRSLKKINFDEETTLFIVCKSELPTLLIHVAAKKAKIVLFQQYSYNDSGLIYDPGERVENYKEERLFNFIFSIISMVFGTYRIKQMHSLSDRKLKIRYVPDLKMAYDSIIVFKNPVTERLDRDNDMFYPFLDLDRNAVDAAVDKLVSRFPALGGIVRDDRSIVVFLGGAFLTWDFIDRNTFVGRLRELLNLIRSRHKGCLFVYIPHPKETEEVEYLDIKDFILLRNILSAEMFFMLFKKRIKMVYSIKSTAAKFSLAFGIPSFLLYKELPFRDESYEHFDSFLDSVYSDFENLEKKPYHIDKNIIDRKIIDSFNQLNQSHAFYL